MRGAIGKSRKVAKLWSASGLRVINTRWGTRSPSVGAKARGSDRMDKGLYEAGPNPFERGPGFNLTRQGELLTKEPARVARLMQQAGFAKIMSYMQGGVE
jgi:hypothetical protein